VSTLAFAALINRREDARPGTSATTGSPGVKTYVDALTALVPAEVLTLHGLILSVTTKTGTDSTGNPVTTIAEQPTLFWSFFALIFLAVIFYLGPRWGRWDKWDFGRAAIPPLAFVAWTMIQRATAFDAVWPSLGQAPRTAIALFVAVLLGLAAAGLGYKADQKQPHSSSRTPDHSVMSA
jgi:hypothetical protein